jgi:hypothetical protein
MKKIFVLSLSFMLVACLQAPSPEVKPIAPESNFKPTLLGSLTLNISHDASLQSAQFTPNRRLSSQALSTVSESTLAFTQETLQVIDRPSSSERYLNAPFKVTNNNAASLGNLTLVAYHKNGNIGGSAFKNIQTFGGTLNPNVNTLLPIHTMTGSGTVVVDNTKADLQIFTRGEIGTLTTNSEGSLINNGVTGEGILHYGYIARKGSTGAYRTIAGTSCNPGANAGCNQGTLNIALRVPQATDPGAASNAYRYSMTFLVFTDSTARVTESLEEQGTTNAATRAGSLGGSPQVVAMCGSSLTAANATYITGVRTVGVGTNTETALMGGKFITTNGTAPNFTVNGNIQKSFTAANGVLDTRFSALGGASLSAALVGTATNSSNIVVNANGSLSINPAAGLRTTDSFNYSISDGTCTWTRPATVTIQNAVTWFVKNNVATTGDGRFSSPFKTLAEAQTASLANDTIYVYNGDNATTGQNSGITLKAGQKFIGQGVAFTVGGDSIEAAGTNAKIGNSAGTAITLNTNNTLSGLDVSSTGTGISGSNFGTLTSSAVNVASTGVALTLVNGTAAATFGAISSDASSSDAVSLTTIAGTLTASGVTVTNTTSTARGITIAGSSGTFDLGTVSINTTGGTGFFVNGGTPTINATAVSISNAGGRGLNMQNVSGGTITLDTLAVDNATQEGLVSSACNNTVIISAGSIQNSGSNNVYMAGGTGSFSYAGTIGDTTGGLVYLENITGGTKTFSGAITGTGTDGIGLLNNSGATINFSGGLNLSTGGQTAFSASGGGTVNVSGTNNTLTTTTATALNVVNTTIGSSGLTFKSIAKNGGTNSAINLNSTGTGTLSVTGTGAAGTGGTIQNISGSDAIRLNNTGGLVSLQHMSIQDISASTDATAANNNHSSVDAIHGTSVNGGLSINNVTIQRISDNGINGSVDASPVTNPPTATIWNGLTITNSTIQNTNRFHVANRGDASDEGAVYIRGLKGTVSVTGSTFQNSSSGLVFTTDTAGTLDMTARNNNFLTLYKEIGTSSIGLFGISVVQEGALVSTVRIGDTATETNAALGNTFTNGGNVVGIRVITNTGSTGNLKTSIAKNTFTVTDHTSPGQAPLNTFYNFPQSGVLLRAMGAGNYEAIFAANMLDEVMHADGGLGQLSIIAERGASEFIVRNNTFKLPWDLPIELRADGTSGGQTSCQVLITGNSHIDGIVGSNSTDLGGQSPYGASFVQVRNNGRLDLTLQNEATPLGLTDTTSTTGTVSLYAQTTTAGDIFNLFLQNIQGPRGYRLQSGTSTTYNLFRNGSASATAQSVLQDNGNRGGSGVDTTNPPTVNATGTINFTNSAPTLPNITAP